jgi:hypothetical protein
MKRLFILCALVLSFTINAQTETEEPITETERIVDKYGGQIIDGFNEVIRNVTPYAEEGFNMVVNLQIAKGIGNLLPTILLFIFIIIFRNEYYRIDNILKSDNIPQHMDKRYGVIAEENSTLILWLSLATCILLFIISLFTIYDGVLKLIAPEWYAIKEIIELF